MAGGTSKRLRSGFNLGGEAAESDPLLYEAFYESGHYDTLLSRQDRRCFLIGRTGSGKSALLQRLQEQHSDHVIRLDPRSLSLTYLTELDVIQYLNSLDVHLDPLFNALWKHVLLVEIIRHRYKIDSQPAKHNFLVTLRQMISRDKSKQDALAYLDDFEGKFWCEADIRLRDVTQKFEKRIQDEAGARLSIPPFELKVGEDGAVTEAIEDRVQLQQKFQRIVNETQLPRLHKMVSVLDEDILDSDQNYTYVLIDDLDQDWVDEKVTNDLIRCLFRSVVELQRVRNLKIIVALRTNIFEHLNFGARDGGQEEKFRALTLNLRWSRHELENLMDRRVAIAANRAGLEHLRGVKDLLPPTNKARGNPLNYLTKHTLMRPRDCLAFLNECLELAAGSQRLTWNDMTAAQLRYSQKRLLALRDEWKPTYQGIGDVFSYFREAGVEMAPLELCQRLDNAILLIAEPAFPGVTWMTKLSESIWSSSPDDWAQAYAPLIDLLYRIGFLGYIGDSTRQAVFAHEDPDFTYRTSNIRGSHRFVIHPAFQSALDIKPDIKRLD